MKLRLVSKKIGSRSLKRLAEGLSTSEGYKVWRSRFHKPKRTNLVYGDCKGKIEQYEYFKTNGISALEYTTQIGVAKEWVQKTPVVCRKLTRSSEGKGIVIAETPEQVVQAPVYTKYKKKKKEFRVHVYQNRVVHVLEKRRKTGFTGETDAKIRNTANGYVFCSGNVIEPDGIRALALAASRVTNSDFKGVDIGYNELKNELFVIEVNSAPGIGGSNVQRYVNTIKGL